MRGIKTITTSVLTVGMTAGLAIGTTAQDAASDLVSSFGWGWSGQPTEASTGDSQLTQTGLASRGEELVVLVEGGDPRASGLMTEVRNTNLVQQLDGPDLFVTTYSQRIVNERGSWSGTGSGTSWLDVPSDADPRPQGAVISVLAGHGDYDGLTLILTGTTPDEPIWGWIVPSSTVPPSPRVPSE